MCFEQYFGNAPGPFYTTGECLSCNVPEHAAPDLLAPLSETTGVTHFRRQPQTAEACSF